MEPSAKVSPIPADLNGASKKNGMEKCKHFSMRNYVSEMRQKDVSRGWPFKLSYILSEVPKDVLPLLDVPKYRWWKCRYCLPEFWVTATDTENGAVPDTSCGKCKFTGTFADAACLSEAATLASNCQLMLNLDMAVAEKCNHKISAEIRPNRCNTPVLSVADRRDDTVQNRSKIIKDADGNNGARKPADNSATRVSNLNESPALYCNGNGRLAAASAENASKAVEVDKQAINRKVTEECENEKVGLLDNSVGQGNEPAPADSPSFDSTEVGPHKSGSSHRRKSRKVRLLTDLLAAVENTSNNHIRKDKALLLPTRDTSPELKKQANAEGEVANCESAKRDVLKKKRKLASEDSIKSSNHFQKNEEKGSLSIVTGTVKNGDTDLDSQSEDNEFNRLFSQISTKSNLPEHVDEARNSISKKKKKNQVIGHSSEMKAISAEIKHAFTSSNGDEFAIGEVGITLSPVPGTSKNICFFKEKKNLPPMPQDQVPVLPWDISSCSGRPFATTDKSVGENLPASVQYWSAKPSSAVNGTHLTSKTSSTVTLRTDKFFISEMRQGPSFHGMEDVLREGNTAKDNTESRYMHVDKSFPSQHVSDTFRSNGVNGTINDGNNYKIPFLNGRQRCAPTRVDPRCFWTPNLGISGASKKNKANKRQEHTAVVQQCCDKSVDPGNPDDIPMEIVELMAKHQYERCLEDAEMDKIPVSRAKKAWDSEIVKITKENSRTGHNLWLKDGYQKREFHPQNVPSIMASKDFGSSALRSFDISSDVSSSNYKVNQMEGHHTPRVHHTFFQDHGMPPHSFQSIGGPSNLGNAQNNVMNEDCSRIKALDGNFLSLGVSGLWYPPNHSEELVPRHSSMRPPDSIPFVYSIMPQSCGLHSNSINCQPHCPRTPPKVEMNCNRDPKLFTSRPNGLQKPEKDLNVKARRGVNMKNPVISRLNGTEHEQRVASLDISSNETIPAMHLLSLMDAGMHSGTKIRLDENVRLSKQPSLPCEYHAKEVCGLHLGLCKTCIPLRHPSFDYDQAKVLPRKYQELSAVPAFSLSASSSQPANAFRSGSVGKPHVPLDVNDKGKGKCYKVGSSGVAPVLTGNVGLGTSYGFRPYHNMGRNLPNSSEERDISPYQRMPEIQKMEARNGIHAIQPPRISPEAAICTVNRNPAEFSLPEEGNVYSIGRDELKLVRRVRNKPELSNARCRGVKKMAKSKHAAGTSQNQPQIV